ncbi:DUF3833 family protein [Sphingomonas sp. GCM10030256]|uniref:DUF3833 family protein n=1 Tax=Sphingomonas sp. GCM10030256 TaxID=3273427 RepID=UPI00361DCCD9
MRVPVLLLALTLASCASVRLPADEGATLDPVAFFTGPSRGIGELKVVMASPVTITVRSVGRRDGAGGLILDQAIREGDKPERTRRWIMRPAGPGRYSGTLTEATGPVSISIQGPRAFIAYAMKDGLAVRQQLALQKDGRTLLNHMTISKYGVRVARLRETIRKAG